MSKKIKKIKSNSQIKTTSKFYDILSIPSNPEDLFTLLYPIGQGAFGQVYKAIHNSTKEIYAIKIIDYSKNNNSENNFIINYNYNSIQQETSLMKLVNQSNYILKYYGSYFSRKSNTLWLILEYCASGSAIDLMLSMDRTLSELEISTIMQMILKGLVIIHKINLIHRDIKGANILLSDDGYAKLADFGVGIKMENEKYRKSKKGSPYWMSPQVALNSNYDTKTDIWSLGITCVELVEGEPPFSEMKPRGVMSRIASNPPTVEEIINIEEHSEEFVDFLRKCLMVDPKKRPSASQLLKHPFITYYAQGRKYISNLIKKNIKKIEVFRKQFHQDLEDINNDNNEDNEGNKTKCCKVDNVENKEGECKDNNNKINDDVCETESEILKLYTHDNNNVNNINENNNIYNDNKSNNTEVNKKIIKNFQFFNKTDGNNKLKSDPMNLTFKSTNNKEDKMAETVKMKKNVNFDLNSSYNNKNKSSSLSNINNSFIKIEQNIKQESKKKSDKKNENSLVSYEEKNSEDKKEKQNYIPGYMRFIKDDNFIYDDNKYIELLTKKFVNNCQTKTNENSKCKFKSNEDPCFQNYLDNNNIVVDSSNNISNSITHYSTQTNSKKCSKAEFSFPKSRNKTNRVNSKNNCPLIKEKKEHNTVWKDSKNIFENLMSVENNNELCINNNKPKKMSYHKNDISYIDNEKIFNFNFNNEENISDSDDETLTNKAKKVHNSKKESNYFQNINIYQSIQGKNFQNEQEKLKYELQKSNNQDKNFVELQNTDITG